jgi:membrane-anchored protein YejM (alkaline phosphatase superfamily)
MAVYSVISWFGLFVLSLFPVYLVVMAIFLNKDTTLERPESNRIVTDVDRFITFDFPYLGVRNIL